MTTALQETVAHGVAAAVRGAMDHGLFQGLGAPCTPGDLARRLDLSPRAVALVLDVMTALGLVREQDGRYVRDDPSPGSDMWRKMDRFLTTGEVDRGIDEPAERGRFYESAVERLGDLMHDAARELAAALPPARAVLDVGAGSGVWSLAMAARCPATRVVGLDLPEVMPCFARAAAPLGDRATAVAGDYFTATVEGPFDRVVLANVLHLEGEARAAALIARHAARLGDGELVIVDFFGDDDGYEARLVRATYALHLGMRTAVGKPYTADELRAFCTGAGLARHRLIPLACTGGAVSALVGRQ